MIPAARLSRRILLRGAGLGGIAATSGCWFQDDRAPSDPAKESAIFDLSFSVDSRFRPFHLVAPEFVQVSEPAGAPGTKVVRANLSPQAPFAAVELDVEIAGEAGVLAGLATQSGDHVAGTYDPVRRQVAIEVRRAGRTRALRTRSVVLPETFRFSFVLCENQITVLTDAGEGWRVVLTERTKVAEAVDLREPGTLSGYTYAWGARRDAGSPTKLGAVRAGLFGMAGLRDPHLVQHSDGRPYVRSGKAYLTFTCAGLGFFQQAHWGVFTLDLADPARLEQVAQLYSFRDGLLLGDHAGQVVRDDENDRWIVATSSWGDFSFDGVHVRHATTTADVLEGVHLLETKPTPLPTSLSSWDAGLTKIDGRWHVAFVESPSQDPFDFHPALAVAAEGSDWTRGLELVGAANDLSQCEGPILARIDDQWWLLASDGDNRVYPVFTPQMRRVGRLDAPYPTNIPHPQIVPLEGGGHLMVTFDGTQYAEKVLGYGSHGDVIVLRSDES